MSIVTEAAGSARNIRSPNHRLRVGSAYKHCSRFHVRVVNGRRREFYYHATKGWRNRAA